MVNKSKFSGTESTVRIQTQGNLKYAFWVKQIKKEKKMVTLRTFSELDLCISHQPSADFSGTERKKRKKIRRKKNAT